jgi:hypothetical protein
VCVAGSLCQQGKGRSCCCCTNKALSASNKSPRVVLHLLILFRLIIAMSCPPCAVLCCAALRCAGGLCCALTLVAGPCCNRQTTTACYGKCCRLDEVCNHNTKVCASRDPPAYCPRSMWCPGAMEGAVCCSSLGNRVCLDLNRCVLNTNPNVVPPPVLPVVPPVIPPPLPAPTGRPGAPPPGTFTCGSGSCVLGSICLNGEFTAAILLLLAVNQWPCPNAYLSASNASLLGVTNQHHECCADTRAAPCFDCPLHLQVPVVRLGTYVGRCAVGHQWSAAPEGVCHHHLPGH